MKIFIPVKIPQLLAFAVALAILAGIWLWDFEPRVKRDVAMVDDLAISRRPPLGLREYQSERYGFSLFYPEDLAVREIDEGGGATTVIFENPQAARGFQIFIVPYEGTLVSEERFLKDAPSGVRESPVDFYLDGVLATAFYGRNNFLGETREIWFIHNGYLYEVTTFKGLGDWFAPIMQTWRFL